MNDLPRISRSVAPFLEALEDSPDPVFVTDRHNDIVFWNRSAEQLLGFAAEEVVGAPCAGRLRGCDVFGNRYCSDHCPVNGMGARSESVRQFTLCLATKDGRVVGVEVAILNLATQVPGAFFLAHILRPVRSDGRAAQPATESQRPSLDGADEPLDVRARKLTPREIEILGMIAAGHATPEIARRLRISAVTVRNHTQNVLEKLEVHSKAEAVAFAFQKRIL